LVIRAVCLHVLCFDVHTASTIFGRFNGLGEFRDFLFIRTSIVSKESSELGFYFGIAFSQIKTVSL
jgi:hypothetical protein